MKIFFDFLPIIVFFAVYKWQGIFAATAISICISAIIVLYLLLSKKKINITLFVNLAIITILGGATLIFHNEWFIKWKPTVVYLIFALIFIISDRFFDKNVMKVISGEGLVLEDYVWRKLSDIWVIFFVIAGALNIFVAYKFSTDTWVNFKLFGLLGITLVFAIIQGFYLAKIIGNKEE